jgi:polyisoprenyl-teichoic acid--peptidoglycan teichoic acid transferase
VRPPRTPRALASRPVALLAALAVAVATVAAVAAPRLAAGRTAARQAIDIQRAHAGAAAPSFNRRIVFLVVGSDSGAPKFGRGGTVEGGLADSLHLVVLDGRRHRGVIIGVPRDSWVPIPGHGTSKINSAMSSGGPPLLIRTFEQLTGIHIDYLVLTSFDGLTDIVNRVGGVTVNVDMNISDHFSGAFFHRGVRRMNGAQALSYSRARKTLPNGDLDRSRHQAQVLLGGLATFQRQSAKDPRQVLNWLAVMRDEVKFHIPFGEVLRLALYARTIAPSQFRNLVVPAVAGQAGSASIVRLLPGAYQLFARVRAGGLS